MCVVVGRLLRRELLDGRVVGGQCLLVVLAASVAATCEAGDQDGEADDERDTPAPAECLRSLSTCSHVSSPYASTHGTHQSASAAQPRCERPPSATRGGLGPAPRSGDTDPSRRGPRPVAIRARPPVRGARGVATTGPPGQRRTDRPAAAAVASAGASQIAVAGAARPRAPRWLRTPDRDRSRAGRVADDGRLAAGPAAGARGRGGDAGGRAVRRRGRPRGARGRPVRPAPVRVVPPRPARRAGGHGADPRGAPRRASGGRRQAAVPVLDPARPARDAERRRPAARRARPAGPVAVAPPGPGDVRPAHAGDRAEVARAVPDACSSTARWTRRTGRWRRCATSWRCPVVVRNHLRKERGSWQAQVVPDAPVNAETLVELESAGGRPWHLPPDAAHGPHPPAARPPRTGSASRSSTTRCTPWCGTSTSTTSADRCSCSPGARVHRPRRRRATAVPERPTAPADDGRHRLLNGRAARYGRVVSAEPSSATVASVRWCAVAILVTMTSAVLALRTVVLVALAAAPPQRADATSRYGPGGVTVHGTGVGARRPGRG